MGVEHDIMASGACPCGAGTIRVERATPDHAWGSGQFEAWSAMLDCEACSGSYRFLGLRLVSMADADAYRARQEALRRAEDGVMRLPAVAEIRSRLAQRLDVLPSKAARHHWLKAVGLESCSYQTFIKHWRDGSRWAGTSITKHNVLQAAGVVDVDPSTIERQFEEIDRCRCALSEKPAAIATGIAHLAA